MNQIAITFWVLTAIVGYTYFVYPMLVALIARLCGRTPRREENHREAVSFVLAAHNEEGRIVRRIDEFFGLIYRSGVAGEVIVVSDGSTDATAARARSSGHPNLTIIDLPQNQGKAAALNAGCAAAQYPILVFGDARQTWDAQALNQILQNFADPRIGAVSGELVLESTPGVMAGVGLYWRYEKWLRLNEGRVHSTVGVTGAICAVRRDLRQTIPAGTILDDVYWPMRVVMQGFRVVHDDRAQAFDRLPAKARDEFRRKVRTMAGNFQLAAFLPGALLPWRNPIMWQFISHKLMRLLVPWALIGMIISAAMLPTPFFRMMLAAQLAFYLFGLASLTTRWASRLPLSSPVASFLVLNSAAWMGLWVWASGGAVNCWHKVRYEA
jgi:cellulose synthase/poly-beta-1,6-N-acetylglucosamine synthase-like glycosyltransferase